MFPDSKTSDDQAREPAQVAPPAPAFTTRYLSFRGDPNYDPTASENAKNKLADYRREYPKNDTLYPFRVTLARHTGLPAHLTGLLGDDFKPGDLDRAEDAAVGLFKQPFTSPALFGVEWDQVIQENRLRRIGTTQLQNDKDQWSAHVHFQQMHPVRKQAGSVGSAEQKLLPVCGGEVVVHMTSGTRRTAISSSYFPLKSELDLELPADLKEAEQRALAGARDTILINLSPVDARDLYWDELAKWLARDSPNDWSADDTQSLSRLLQGLDPNNPQSAFEQTQSILMGFQSGAGLDPIKKLAEKTRVGAARLATTSYAGSKLFILPHAGRFSLAFRIDYVPYFGTPWRIFIDAQSGAALGAPNPLALFASAFPSSADVTGHNPQNFPITINGITTTIADVTNGLRDVVHLFDNNCAVVNLNTANDEATNVAFHAKRMHDYFLGLANPGNPVSLQSFVNDAGARIQPGLEMIVGYPGLPLAPNAVRPDLTMGFMFFDRSAVLAISGFGFNQGTNSAQLIDPCLTQPDLIDQAAGLASLRADRKLLLFQSDSGSGLNTVEGKVVVTPSLDPEVIYHELTHAFMWMLNRAPFDQHNESVPFWRALTEGYADYFARSFAARSDIVAPMNNRWAQAAFKNFGDERALSRNSQVGGEDFLEVANLYPEDEVAGGGINRVGMIWARALWEIRTFFNTPRAGVTGNPCKDDASQRGIQDVDRWALHAYLHLVGWVANLEGAAEAFINEASRTGEATSCEIEKIKDIFVGRGIYAERGLQAVAERNNTIAVGAYLGLRRFTGVLANPWADAALENAVALTFSDPTTNPVVLYASTETGVFQHPDFPNNAWQPVGNWVAGEMPVCMTWESGLLFVGTAHGVYFADPANPQWQLWNPPAGSVPFSGLAFNIFTGALPGNDGNFYRVCLVADLANPAGMNATGAKFNILTDTPTVGRTGALRTSNRIAWRSLPLIANGMKQVSGTTHILSGRPTAAALAVSNPTVPVANQSTNLYIGTLGRGVWCQLNVVHRVGFSLTSSAVSEMKNANGANILEGLAVLCLVHDNFAGRNRLLAGTNDGVFIHDVANGGSGWQPLPGLPARSMVRQIAPTVGEPLLATYNQGLLFHNGASWQSFKLE